MSIARRLQPFGQTVFSEMTQLALEHEAINLGQGFPNFDGPEWVKDAAAEAMRRGQNQYARSSGVPALNRAIAARFAGDSGIATDPDREVTVTSGCTEALAATFLGLIEPGDEVVLIEPFYDAYPVDATLAGAVVKTVVLRPPAFRLDDTDLVNVVSDATRAIVVNTPHNPTGRVFDDAELELLAGLCLRHDVVAICDEVYEHMVYEGRHRSLATLDGMWERTITLSSLGKTFSFTGWKIGWAIAPPPLTAAVRAAHQFLTFATATPLQHAAATALAAPDEYFVELVAAYRARRDVLVDGLRAANLDVFTPQGTYFVLASHAGLGLGNDVAFARYLTTEVGVAAIPPSAFYSDPADGASLIRFAFCKDEATLQAAVDRLVRHFN